MNPFDRSAHASVPSSSGALGMDDFDLREYLLVLRRRWLPVFLVAVAVFVFMANRTLKERKMYEATSKLVVTTKNGARAVGASSQYASTLQDVRQARDVETQLELINSPDLIEDAYARIPRKTQIAGFGTTTPPGGAYTAAAKPDTDVITITGRAFTPSGAAAIANAVAEAYLDEDLKRNSQATRQARKYVESEMTRIGSDLAKASEKLADFKRQTGLVAAASQSGDLAKVHDDLRNALDTARGEALASHQRLKLIRRQIADTAPEIANATTIAENPQFGAVRTQLIALEAKAIEMGQEYTPTSPEMTQLNDQIKDVKERIQFISRTVVSARSMQLNPLRQKLLTDYADTQAADIVAGVHVQALSSQLGRLEGELKGYPDQERRLGELQQRADVLSRTYGMLSDRYYSLLIDERSSLSSGIIAARATPPGAPSSPQVAKNLTTALFLALILGFATGFLLEKLDTKAHSPIDVEKLYGLASLALIPEATSTEGAGERLVIGRASPNHAFTEGFRLLRNNIGFLSPDDPIRVVGVTSAAMGEGKSTTSVNLAIAMGMDGKRVLLIDADLRRPTIQKWMGLSNEIGFSSVVRGLTPLVEAIHTTEYEGVSCLTSGPVPPDPTEFLNSERSHELLRQAKGLYDMVVVDAPPCTGLSDTQIISTMVDGMLVVAALDKTPKPLMTAAIRLLRQANANVLGLVINRMKENSGGYGYYSYYGYGYSYDQDSPGSNGRRKSVRRREKVRS